jgi:hypothetical protein
MGQRFALVAVEQNDVAGCGLLFEKLQAQADPLDFAWHLAALQRVPGAPPTELFFRRAVDRRRGWDPTRIIFKDMILLDFLVIQRGPVFDAGHNFDATKNE